MLQQMGRDCSSTFMILPIGRQRSQDTLHQHCNKNDTLSNVHIRFVSAGVVQNVIYIGEVRKTGPGHAKSGRRGLIIDPVVSVVSHPPARAFR
jgi:hypothetical protein